MMKEKVILAYSGGLDTTTIIPWLKENFGYEVVCAVSTAVRAASWTDWMSGQSCPALPNYTSKIWWTISATTISCPV